MAAMWTRTATNGYLIPIPAAGRRISIGMLNMPTAVIAMFALTERSITATTISLRVNDERHPGIPSGR
jgi:hypothetical protein